jgi:hypothetical protein
MSLRAALTAGGPLSALAAYPRFIVYKLVWLPDENKWDKRPCSPRGEVSNAHNPNIHCDWETSVSAAAALGEGYGVGFVFTEADGFWFLDIDKCFVDGQWSAVAQQLLSAFPGAAVEVSVSGTGLHVFGRGTVPAHGCRNIPLALEFYTKGRFCALTGTSATGNAAMDWTPQVEWLVANYFPAPTVADFDERLWLDTSVPPERDADTIQRMLNSKSGADAAFGNKATVRQLWEADQAALGRAFPADGRPYDASSADAALAQHCAFWTRKNAPQMWRIMHQSKLVREKWSVSVHKDYLQRTIERAISLQGEGLKDDPVPVPPAALAAMTPLAPATRDPMNMDDFVSYLPDNDYIYLKTMANWKKEAVNKALGVGAADALDMSRPVHCRAWDPTRPREITGEVMAVGTDGWIKAPGSTTLNTFQESTAIYGEASLAKPWSDQVKRLYPKYWEHIVMYFAWLVQHPGNKPNHGLVMGGKMGIGKDSILEGAMYAIGKQNVQDISPSAIFGDFTPWAKCILLRINEAHDVGDRNGPTRAQFYERMKTVVASPPDSLTYNTKNVKSYPIKNCCGVVITTNHETGSMHLPADDRRYFVVWSEASKEDYNESQWTAWWTWFEGEGRTHVAAYLKSYDVSKFNPKAPPPKTEAWRIMVAASVSDGDLELADALDAMGRPKVITLDSLRASITLGMHKGLAEDLDDRKTRARWTGRLSTAGYTPCHNVAARDGCFLVAGNRVKLYVQRDLSEGERQTAAAEFTKFREIPAPPK